MKLREQSLNECITIIDRELPDRVNKVVDYLKNLPLETIKVNNLNDLVKSQENDSRQKTQSSTKMLQVYINLCLTDIVNVHHLPITGIDQKGADIKYVGNGQEIPIEIKCSAQKDGATACIGNLKVLDSKSDLTLALRFALGSDDRITHWQTVTIDDSNRKWTEYNDKENNSNFSRLRCKSDVDYQDITVYSGSIKPNGTWVKFIKEAVC
tara:strand:- start:43 stop:672 length:630 start_codon:yes stop_codon:yes gene_type:complete